MHSFYMVGHFHRKFGLQNTLEHGCAPRELTPNEALFRLKFLLEELTETAQAMGYDLVDFHGEPLKPMFQARVTGCDLPAAADGLVDLVYVALGTAHLMGLPWDDLFREVQRANLSKVRATSDAESLEKTGRGNGAMDIVKPEGWIPPRIAEILKNWGWNDGR